MWPCAPASSQASCSAACRLPPSASIRISPSGPRTVTASVQKRPDVTVYGVYAPPRAPVNTPIQIGAVIAELNADVGAHTDCVLYVNDVETDRANGIWVDSGDAVTCAFNPTFTFSAVLKHGRVVAGKGWFDVDARPSDSFFLTTAEFIVNLAQSD